MPDMEASPKGARLLGGIEATIVLEATSSTSSGTVSPRLNSSASSRGGKLKLTSSREWSVWRRPAGWLM